MRHDQSDPFHVPSPPTSRRRLAVLLAVAAMALAAMAVGRSGSPEAEAARTPRTGAADLFVVGTEQDLGDASPSITRVSSTGEIRWSRPLVGLDDYLTLGLHGADRNITEDSFYIWVSDGGRNLLGGEGQLQRYDGRGELTWAIGIEGTESDVMVSADPVRGGVYVATSAGVARVDKRGEVLWGPLDFGLGALAGHWGVAVDTSDGSAFVTAHGADRVLKVEPDAEVRWSIELAEPGVPMFSPLDHGAYVGQYSYARDTAKLSRTGRVEWVRESFPSSYTYGRAVNPVDGSLYVQSGWDSFIGQLSRTGSVMAEVYISGGWGPIGNQGLAVSLDGRHLYTANCCDDLGVDAYSLSWRGLTQRWRVTPDWYETTDNAYAPYYRPFVGMPRVP